MRAIELWWRRAIDADALRPLRFLEPTLMAMHRLLRLRARAPRDAAVPVISVGSPLLGGSGKTPLTQWIGQTLGEHLRVAIVSRGYRRSSHGLQLVSDGRGTLADVEVAGDELLMLARRVPRAVVVANADRQAAIIRAAEFGAQVVCLDDALQNQSVRKDLNLVVLHHDESQAVPRPFPLGRLRIPLSEVADADALVMICPASMPVCGMSQVKLPRWMPSGLPLVMARLRHAGFWDAHQHTPVNIAAGAPVAAWTSIASPRRFFTSLSHEGLVMTDTRIEPDHQKPEPKCLQRWAYEQRKRGASALCCTEKDAMHPLPSLCLPVVYLRIELEFPLGDQTLIRLLEERVYDGIARNHSR